MSPATPPAFAQTPAVEPPLDKPYYGATIGIAARRFFKKYATFSGRASRSEYWWWTLIAVLVSFVLNIISFAVGGGGVGTREDMTPGATVVTIIAGFWVLATIVPSLALIWRRLHDTNRSGAWYLLILIPLVGAIILLVFFVGESKPEGQRFDR
jgi:uncharacterized membrane protein YhaH (DUF805 family)